MRACICTHAHVFVCVKKVCICVYIYVYMYMCVYSHVKRHMPIRNIFIDRYMHASIRHVHIYIYIYARVCVRNDT